MQNENTMLKLKLNELSEELALLRRNTGPQLATKRPRDHGSGSEVPPKRKRIAVGVGTKKSDRRHLQTLASQVEEAVEPYVSVHGVEVAALYVRDELDRVHGIMYRASDAAEIHCNTRKPFLTKNMNCASWKKKIGVVSCLQLDF